MAASQAGANDYKGEMIGYWYATGRYDCYSILRAPDLLTASALHAAIFSSGAFLEFHHTVLLTLDEMKESVRMSNEWPSLRNYRPPGAPK